MRLKINFRHGFKWFTLWHRQLPYDTQRSHPYRRRMLSIFGTNWSDSIIIHSNGFTVKNAFRVAWRFHLIRSFHRRRRRKRKNHNKNPFLIACDLILDHYKCWLKRHHMRSQFEYFNDLWLELRFDFWP